jgi:molybdopterin-guanine dinucleotide biosynthesis protein B
MRAVNVVGFKDTGKTTLCASLMEALGARGLACAALKFTHQAGLDKEDTDTAKLLGAALSVGAIGESEAAVFWRGAKTLADLAPLLGGEVLVVEGGKPLGVLPRIVLARSASEARELGAGEGGLAIAVFGPEGVDGVPAVTDMARLAALADERAFLLPGLDCGGCGRESCRALAVEIVAGKAAASECVALGGEISITVNGAELALNPFVARILRSGVTAMLGELKGYAPGETVIRIRK